MENRFCYLRDAHLISGQRSGLVGANNVGASQGLNAGQVAHDSVLLGHLLSSECETSSDDSCETFRNGSHGERDSDLEVVDSPLEKSMVCGVGEIADVDEPDEDADNGDDFSETVAKVVQLLLERRLFRDLRRDGLVNITNSRV